MNKLKKLWGTIAFHIGEWCLDRDFGRGYQWFMGQSSTYGDWKEEDQNIYAVDFDENDNMQIQNCAIFNVETKPDDRPTYYVDSSAEFEGEADGSIDKPFHSWYDIPREKECRAYISNKASYITPLFTLEDINDGAPIIVEPWTDKENDSDRRDK